MPADATHALWPDGSPNNPAEGERPRLEVYLPKGTPAARRGAVLVLPGGGYNHLAAHEGEPFGRFFADQGFVGVVCRYRVLPHTFPAPFADAARAARMVRALADRYAIAPDRIAAIGFSAGAHLAATIGTQPNLHVDPQDDLAGIHSARPDRLILAYGALSMLPGGNPGLGARLFGDDVTEEQREMVSAERHVTASTPPTFLFHTADDPRVPVANSLRYLEACRAAGVPVELHAYESGRHGVGLAADNPRLSSWTGLLLDWLRAWE
jgi:acetyl esterase/lipase